MTGTNPTLGTLALAAPSNDAFRKLMRVESGLKQFLGPVCPYFSEDNRGGVGICQVTDSPSDDDVWSWKVNLKSGWSIYQGKESVARQHPAQVRNSANFKALVKAYNENRLAQNKATGAKAPVISKPGDAAKTPELTALEIDIADLHR